MGWGMAVTEPQPSITRIVVAAIANNAEGVAWILRNSTQSRVCSRARSSAEAMLEAPNTTKLVPASSPFASANGAPTMRSANPSPLKSPAPETLLQITSRVPAGRTSWMPRSPTSARLISCALIICGVSTNTAARARAKASQQRCRGTGHPWKRCGSGRAAPVQYDAACERTWEFIVNTCGGDDQDED